MSAESHITSVLDELRRRFRDAGRGSMTQVREELGLGESYFRDQRRHDRALDLRVLLRTLELLDVDPAELFAAAFGQGDPVAGFCGEARRLKKRLRKLPAIIATVERRRAEETDEGEPIDLAALDGGRDDDPRRVRRAAAGLAARAPVAQLCDLLGIYASACRAAGRHLEAHVVLARAVELAQADGDQRALGDLLLRCVSLVIDHGQFERALSLAEQATLHYIYAADLVGIGKGLLKQGIALGYLERVAEEADAFTQALGYFPADSPDLEVRRNRFSALMNLAIARRKGGDLAAAERLAGEASAAADGVGRDLLGKLRWLQGSLAAEVGDHARAEHHFRAAHELFTDVTPLSAALVSVDVVRAQLLQGRTAEAHATAQAMAAVIRPLAENELAAAALAELTRCAAAGQGLTLTLLDRLATDLKRRRRRR